MTDSDEQVITRARWLMFLFLPLAVLNAGLALFRLILLGDVLGALLSMITAALWATAAFLFTRPVARLTQASISVRPAPIRAERVISWSTVASATLSRMNILELTIAGAKPLKLSMDQVRKDQRQSLLDVVESRVGVVTRLP
jgi:hypothetical protein